MPEITGGELEEFNYLRSLYNREAIQNSLISITELEDDIDMPIKKCVMMLALLGCEPVWSCCGFDYIGQPVHKKHHHGATGFRLRDNINSRWLSDELEQSPPMYQRYANFWMITFWSQYSHDWCTLSSNIERGNTWPDRDCIHYSEPAVIAIAVLESWLIGYYDRFQERVVLKDSNGVFRDRFPQWQYPAKSDWIIAKSELDNNRSME